MNAPRLARLLIGLAAGAHHRDDALGDLEEAHRQRRARGVARAWLGSIAEALVIAPVLLWQRGSRAHPLTGLFSLGDVRLGVRLLLRQPLLSLTAIVALAVGIGLANVGFATTEALVFSRLPFENGDRFVRLLVVTENTRESAQLSEESSARVVAAATALDHVGAMATGREGVEQASGVVEELLTASVTPSSFRYLPVTPLRGRLLSSDDAATGREPVVLINESYWRRAWAGAESAIGSRIVVRGTSRTVVGILPTSFEFPNRPALWLPLTEGFRDGRSSLASGARLFGVMGPGATLETLSTQLAAIAPQLHPLEQVGLPAAPRNRANPADPAGTGLRVDAVGFTDLGPLAPELSLALIITMVSVLVVIAANVGNLVLARSLSRVREFALRAALGASRSRLIAQVVVEVLVLGSIAAALGSLAAHVALRQFNAMDELPFWVDFTGGVFTAALVIATTLLATVVAGAWPALRATRRDLLTNLQSSGSRASDARFGAASGVMVVLQIALSIVMLHGALVVAQGFRDYNHVPLDLPGNVLTLRVGLTADGLSGDAIEETAASIPGVIAAGIATSLPRHSPQTKLIELEPVPGQAALPARLAPSAAVSTRYFDVMNAAARAGRLLNIADGRPGALPVAVVNEPFVRSILHGTSPLGRRFRALDNRTPGPWLSIVGVVPDLGLSVGDPTLAAGYYLPISTNEDAIYLAVRVTGEPHAYAEPLRRALRTRDPNVSMGVAERLEDVAADDRAFFAVFSSALVGIGAITLVLALMGVYAMMSLIVARRTREIGIRVALGASTTRIFRTVARRAAVQVATGGVIGAVLALWSLEARGLLVSRLGDGGAWTLPAVIGLLVVAGISATWVPLRRALRIRPQEALKAD